MNGIKANGWRQYFQKGLSILREGYQDYIDSDFSRFSRNIVDHLHDHDMEQVKVNVCYTHSYMFSKLFSL